MKRDLLVPFPLSLLNVGQPLKGLWSAAGTKHYSYVFLKNDMSGKIVKF